jgi:hypothetical protein
VFYSRATALFRDLAPGAGRRKSAQSADEVVAHRCSRGRRLGHEPAERDRAAGLPGRSAKTATRCDRPF